MRIDLDYDSHNWSMCMIGWDCGPDWSDYTGVIRDYSDPNFLVKFTESLRDAGLDPQPPEWPLA